MVTSRYQFHLWIEKFLVKHLKLLETQSRKWLTQINLTICFNNCIKFFFCISTYIYIYIYIYIWEMNKNLVQFPFTKSKAELDNNYKKLYIRTDSTIAERLKTQYLKKQGYIRKIPNSIGTHTSARLVLKNVCNRVQEIYKKKNQSFLVLSNFAGFLNFPHLNFLAKYIYIFFLSGFSFTDTDDRTAGEGRGTSFIPLYQLHPLTNIQTFIWNFACIFNRNACIYQTATR